MKKLLFMFLGISLLVSCSSDDNVVLDEERLGELVIKVEQGDYYIGDTVTIKVETTQGEEVKGARLFVDDVQVNALYEFSKAGQLAIVAKKEGYRASKAVEVKVNEWELLVLSTDVKGTYVGGKITFSIKNAANKDISTAKVYNYINGEELKDLSYVPNEEGLYSFIAKGKGCIDSQVISVKVIKNGNSFWVDGVPYTTDELSVEYSRTRLKDKTIVDKVVVVDGVAMNILEVGNTNLVEEGSNYLEITFLIPNPTIKLNDKGAVIDYGQRVDFNNTSSWKVNDVFFMDDKAENIMLSFFDSTLVKSSSKIVGLSIPNNGKDAGKKGIKSNVKSMDINASGVLEGKEIDVKMIYTGDFKFSEVVRIF